MTSLRIEANWQGHVGLACAAIAHVVPTAWINRIQVLKAVKLAPSHEH